MNKEMNIKREIKKIIQEEIKLLKETYLNDDDTDVVYNGMWVNGAGYLSKGEHKMIFDDRSNAKQTAMEASKGLKRKLYVCRHGASFYNIQTNPDA